MHPPLPSRCWRPRLRNPGCASVYTQSVVDLRGAPETPPRVQILSFSYSFRPKNRLVHPLWELAPPPSGKSWIRHYQSNKFLLRILRMDHACDYTYGGHSYWTSLYLCLRLRLQFLDLSLLVNIQMHFIYQFATSRTQKAAAHCE